MITEKQQGKKSRFELHEMIDNIEKAEPAKRVDMLREYSRFSDFTDYLRCVFDPKVQFLLPQGEAPPYEKCSEQHPPSAWHRQHTKLAYFVKGLPKAEGVNPVRREKIFIDILESVHPDSASILVDMINKKSSVKGLTEELVKEALPQIIS